MLDRYPTPLHACLLACAANDSEHAWELSFLWPDWVILAEDKRKAEHGGADFFFRVLGWWKAVRERCHAGFASYVDCGNVWVSQGLSLSAWMLLRGTWGGACWDLLRAWKEDN